MAKSWEVASWLRAVLLAGAAASSHLLHTPSVPGSDLESYLAAGRLQLEDRAEAVYDHKSLREAHHRGGGVGRVGGFWSSPLWLPLAERLAELPPPAAMQANRLLLVAANAIGLAFLLHLLAQPGWQLATAVSFALAHPVRAGLAFGNWGAFVFAFLSFATRGLRRGSKTAAAIGVGFACHLKLWAAWGTLALLRVRDRWVWLGSAVGGSLLLAVLGVLLTGFRPWQEWIRALMEYGERGVTPYYNKVSLAAALARFFADPRAWLVPREPLLPELTQGISALGLGVVVAIGLSRRWNDPLTRWAAGWVLALLAVPTVWDHGYGLLFLAVPALSPSRRGLLLLALAGSGAYPYGAAWLLRRTLQGELEPGLVAAYLAFYPLLGLWTLWALLSGGRGKLLKSPEKRASIGAAELGIALALLLFAGFAWLTRNPVHPLLDEVTRRCPLLAPTVQAFRKAWGVEEMSRVEEITEPRVESRTQDPLGSAAPAKASRGAGFLETRPRAGRAAATRPQAFSVDSSERLVSPAERSSSWVPPPRPIQPELRELVERFTGQRLVPHGLGPYGLLMEGGAEFPRARWEKIVSALDSAYFDRYGLQPRGVPAEAILLFSKRETFEAVVREIEPALDTRKLQGLATRGAALLRSGPRPIEEVESSLIHETVHLINRRAFTEILPPWLEEGIAEGIALARFEPDRGFVWGELREVRTVRPGGVELGGGFARLLELGGSLDQLPALGEFLSREGEGWFEAEPELARAASGLWVFFLLQNRHSPEAGAFREFLRGVAAGEAAEPAKFFELLKQKPSELEASWRSWIQREQERYLLRLRLEGLELSLETKSSSVRHREVPSS